MRRSFICVAMVLSLSIMLLLAPVHATPDPGVPEFPIDVVTLTSVIAVIGYILKTILLKKKED